MNLQNLTPYEAGDGRTAERKKGGLISGYNRLKKHAWQDVFSYKMLEYDINDYVRKNQNKPIGKKRMAELKELAHRKKILQKRIIRNGKKLKQRKADLLEQGIEL